VKRRGVDPGFPLKCSRPSRRLLSGRIETDVSR